MQKGRIREAGPEQSGQRKGREICASLPFASVCVYSECILFGRTVIIGLELTVRGISHQIDFLRQFAAASSNRVPKEGGLELRGRCCPLLPFSRLSLGIRATV